MGAMPQRTYLFKPVNEQVLVFEAPSRFSVHVTAGMTPSTRQSSAVVPT
jgi:hypothetical protein